MLARVAARLDRVLLIVAVHRLLHPLEEEPVPVGGKERIPVGSPDHLDDVPARAAERGFELLDDLAVAAHRTVEPLQVAVHDPDQIVEFLARRERERAERLRLVGFAVADEAPDPRLVALS